MTNIINTFKKKIADYLERMAEENKKNFSNQRLDCCSMNKGNKTHLSKGNIPHHNHQ